MTFRFKALAADDFSHLYGRSDEGLTLEGIVPYIADSKPGYPCRVTMVDAEPGERLLLLNYEHLPVSSPYRSAHAIFVKDGGRTQSIPEDSVPEMVLSRLVSIRAFDRNDMMTDAVAVKGPQAEEEIRRMFDKEDSHYIHVHTAMRGCYLAHVERT